MDRNTIIDRIIRELHRQATRGEGGNLSVAKGKDPDTFHVMGLLDVHKLATAIGGE
jgi:hypothetical protein